MRMEIEGTIRRATMTNEGRPWQKYSLLVLSVPDRELYFELSREANRELNSGELSMHTIKRISAAIEGFGTTLRLKAKLDADISVTDSDGNELEKTDLKAGDRVKVAFDTKYHLLFTDSDDIVGVQLVRLFAVEVLNP